MRNLTKDSRLTSRAYQFTKLIEGGYLQETYKGLDFFTKDEGKYFTLKVYRGTAANHIEYINYRTAERRADVIQNYKNSYENRIKYKAEQKEANNGKTKITLATLKAFLNKNEANIYIKVNSRFDGMSDMVESVEDNFSKVVRSEDIKDNDLGFAGLWLVGSSRDSISIYQDNEFTGFAVWNCCGSCIVATKKEEVKELQQNTTTSAPVGKIQVIDYSEKAIAVIGETKPIKEKLKELGGSFNPRLTCGAGWIFPKTKLQAIKDYLTANKEKEQTEVKEPLQVQEETEESATLLHPEFAANHPLNICDPESGQYKECVKEYLTQNTSPAIYTDLKEIRQEAKNGKLISLYNLSQLANQ